MTLPLLILFFAGVVALLISLSFFQQASRRLKHGKPFVRSAGYAFLSLLLSAVLCLTALFRVAALMGK